MRRWSSCRAFRRIPEPSRGNSKVSVIGKGGLGPELGKRTGGGWSVDRWRGFAEATPSTGPATNPADSSSPSMTAGSSTTSALPAVPAPSTSSSTQPAGASPRRSASSRPSNHPPNPMPQEAVHIDECAHDRSPGSKGLRRGPAPCGRNRKGCRSRYGRLEKRDQEALPDRCRGVGFAPDDIRAHGATVHREPVARC